MSRTDILVEVYIEDYLHSITLATQEKEFSFKIRLSAKIPTHTPPSPLSATTARVKGKLMKEKPQCVHCKRYFASEASVRSHNRWCLYSTKQQPTTFKCEDCGKEYSNKDLLEKHENIHNTPHLKY